MQEIQHMHPIEVHTAVKKEQEFFVGLGIDKFKFSKEERDSLHLYLEFSHDFDDFADDPTGTTREVFESNLEFLQRFQYGDPFFKANFFEHICRKISEYDKDNGTDMLNRLEGYQNDIKRMDNPTERLQAYQSFFMRSVLSGMLGLAQKYGHEDSREMLSNQYLSLFEEEIGVKLPRNLESISSEFVASLSSASQNFFSCYLNKHFDKETRNNIAIFDLGLAPLVYLADSRDEQQNLFSNGDLTTYSKTFALFVDAILSGEKRSPYFRKYLQLFMGKFFVKLKTGSYEEGKQRVDYKRLKECYPIIDKLLRY